MPSRLQKLSADLIVYSVLIADEERLDFKNDALAGVRANYFNANHAPQREKTSITLDGRKLSFRCEMKQGEPLSWKISGGSQPCQTVKRGADGSYCVLSYTDNGTVCKRAYFDRNHLWQRTEYYGRDIGNSLTAVVSPFRSEGLYALRVEKTAADGSRTVARLYPSEKRQNVRCAALMYSNAGMLWYDARFAPSLTDSAPVQSGRSRGFDFRPEDFTDMAPEPLDFRNAPPLSDGDIAAVASAPVPVAEEIGEEERPYSAYDRIQSILLEAQKTNKSIFGEVASYAERERAAESVELAEPVPEEVPPEETAPVSEEAPGEISPEVSAPQPKQEYEAEEEKEPDMGISTPNGVYSYYGALDENGQREGRGRTASPDGVTVYDGEYHLDKRSGFGICYYKDGSPNYVGDWLEGSRSGRGMGFRRSDGTVHAGKWTQNVPNGIGARFDSEGEFLDVCRYENGVRSGKSVSFDEQGNVVIRVWEDGELISERIITDGE